MAWQVALGAADPLLIEHGKASNWRAATRHKNRRGYGRWLTFLTNAGADLLAPPSDRVTQERIEAYLAELQQQGVAPYTLRNRILELLAVMLAIAPERNWSWLRACGVHLDRKAADALDRSLPPVLASDLVNRGMKELRRRAQAPVSCREAIEYRDWLMLTILAVLPLRLRNFARSWGHAAHDKAGRHLVD